MKAIKIFSLILLIFAAGIFFISCPDNDLGNKGTLVIKLPGGDNSSRAVMDGFIKETYLNELKYSIVCEGAGPTIKSEGSAGQYIQLYLTPGKWDITLTVINRNGRVTGSQTKTVNIEAGKTNSLNFEFTLDEPIYFTTRDSSYANNDDGEWIEQFFWETGINRKFDDYYSKPLVNNSTYHITVKGYSNVQMDNVRMDIYFYRGSNKENPWEGNWDDNWKIIGNMWNEPYQKIPEGEFGLNFNVTTDFSKLNNGDIDKLNETDRVYYHIENFIPYAEEEGIIKAAITHFNMTVKELLSFDMVVWNNDGKSGWSSGHDRNTPIKVVPDYINSIKSNTTYKITARGRSSADMKEVQGQFQAGLGSEATNFDVNDPSESAKINVAANKDFNIILYVTTNDNNGINQNQRNMIFNLISNGSDQPANNAGEVMATISNFSMKIEEVITAPNGLMYTLNDDRESFSVRGSEATTGDVDIPHEWQETDNSPRWPVTIIADWAFSENKNITSVSLSNGLISIGRDAFGQTLLTDIAIPASVVTIGRGVFYRTSSLKSVVIPEDSSLESIGEMAFEETGITNILIPKWVESIGRSAFYGHSNLENVTILAVSPPDLSLFDEDKGYDDIGSWGGHFTGKNGIRPVFHVPADSLDDYKDHDDWGGHYGEDNFFPIE